MVKGNESLVVCSFAWERSVPDVAELSCIKQVADMLAAQGARMYADGLDPNVTDRNNEIELFRNSEPYMTPRGLWLVIAAGKRYHTLLAAQAGLAIAREMRVVLGYQDEMVGSLPLVEDMAIKTGRVFYYGDRQEFFDGIEDVVLPMCDNSVNDCDTNWTRQRKTA